MKRLSLYLLTTLLTLVVGCSKFDDSAIWDKLNALEGRTAALEQLCKQMNTNIASLQTVVAALQNNDYVTSIAPIIEEGETIGYTIIFSKSGAVSIYNGGKGADGATPKIGIKKDTDDVYYWTLNGEWLLDDNGNKVKSEGVIPKLKIVNDYWCVSYDGGKNWDTLGKATGENDNDNDSLYKDIIFDNNYIYIILLDGSEIRLPKHNNEYIHFEDLLTKALCCNEWDTNLDGELSYSEASAVTNFYIRRFFDGEQNPSDYIVSFNEFQYFTGLTEIGSDSFSGCYNLSQITLPESITEISSYTFHNCYTLSKITIPQNVTTIGESAFRNCYSLQYIYCTPTTPPTLGEGVFIRSRLKKIYVPEEAIVDYLKADGWKDMASKIEPYNFK